MTTEPPPMVPSVEDRIAAAWVDKSGEPPSMRELMEACYRDGWNAALTAQPPAEIITVSEEEWEHFIATMNAPAMPNEKLMELLTKRPPWESEPPQPGDAERRRAQLQWDIVHAPGYHEAAAIALREFDAAQSAARAQGVREERERYQPLVAAAQAVLAQYEPHEIVDAEAGLRDTLNALDAQERPLP